ncbi:MAG: hypothetical protein HGA85_07515 [Nanoarchaeota archaeon]|nr:hypothetical protein [Nanoarchaeota archaeon]
MSSSRLLGMLDSILDSGLGIRGVSDFSNQDISNVAVFFASEASLKSHTSKFSGYTLLSNSSRDYFEKVVRSFMSTPEVSYVEQANLVAGIILKHPEILERIDIAVAPPGEVQKGYSELVHQTLDAIRGYPEILERYSNIEKKYFSLIASRSVDLCGAADAVTAVSGNDFRERLVQGIFPSAEYFIAHGLVENLVNYLDLVTRPLALDIIAEKAPIFLRPLGVLNQFADVVFYGPQPDESTCREWTAYENLFVMRRAGQIYSQDSRFVALQSQKADK